MKSYVYVITCLVNQKQYVGKTKDPDERMRGHFLHGPNRPKLRQVIHEAVKKYGSENFRFEVVSEHETEEEAFSEEHRLILEKRSQGVHLYNMNDGGVGGCSPTEETRKKMSDSRKGIKLSNETKKKLSEAAKIQMENSEYRKIVGETTKSRWESYTPEQKEAHINRLKSANYGHNRKLTDEAKEKISRALIERSDRTGRARDFTEDYTYNCNACGTEVTRKKVVGWKPPRVNGLCKPCNNKRIWEGRRASKEKKITTAPCDSLPPIE
jgi:group I intron endonuclease